MQLVVCEKPSVGATLAKALGASDHKNGYIEGDNIIVSWCIGHLVELASGDVYDERYKKWSIEELIPFVDKFPKDTQLYKIMTTRLSETE